LEKEGADDIVERANGTLSLSILSQGVGTWHAKVVAMVEEAGAGAGVRKLMTIVALKLIVAQNCVEKAKKLDKSIKSVRF
jgi:hypothetical protein